MKDTVTVVMIAVNLYGASKCDENIDALCAITELCGLTNIDIAVNETDIEVDVDTGELL